MKRSVGFVYGLIKLLYSTKRFELSIHLFLEIDPFNSEKEQKKNRLLLAIILKLIAISRF